MSPVFSSLQQYLEEKRLAFRPFFFTSIFGESSSQRVSSKMDNIEIIPLITKWPSLLLCFLILSLPFVFRFLRLHDEEELLLKKHVQLDMEIVKEQNRKTVLGKEQRHSENPRFFEVLMMERLGVVPRGARVISKE